MGTPNKSCFPAIVSRCCAKPGWCILQGTSFVGLANSTLIPWINYMCSGYRDSDIGVSVSASLAHSDYKWIMGCASLGVITQLGSACYYWRKEIDEEVSSAEGNGSCCSMLNPRNWVSKGSLLKGSMYSWSIGMVSAWFTAFWPMGGDTNALHYPDEDVEMKCEALNTDEENPKCQFTPASS